MNKIRPTRLAGPAPEGQVAEDFIEAMTSRASGANRLRSAIDGLLALTPSEPLGSASKRASTRSRHWSRP